MVKHCFFGIQLFLWTSNFSQFQIQVLEANFRIAQTAADWIIFGYLSLSTGPNDGLFVGINPPMCITLVISWDNCLISFSRLLDTGSIFLRQILIILQVIFKDTIKRLKIRSIVSQLMWNSHRIDCFLQFVIIDEHFYFRIFR